MEGTCTLIVNGKHFDLGPASWEITRPITVRIEPTPPTSFSWSGEITMKPSAHRRLLRALDRFAPPKKRNMLCGRAGEAFRRRQERRALLAATVVAAAVRAGAVDDLSPHGAGT